MTLPSNETLNKKVLITRDRESAAQEIVYLESYGVEVVPFPTIQISPVNDFSELDEFLLRIKEFNYLLFTSKNAVEIVFSRQQILNISFPDTLNIVCIGPKTYEKAVECKYNVELISENFSAAGLLEEFGNIDLRNKSFLIPASTLAREELREGLKSMGAHVEVVYIYETLKANMDELANKIKTLSRSLLDAYIFTSPSSYVNFLAILSIENPSEYFNGAVVVAIGNTTKAEIEKSGVGVSIVPEIHTIKSCCTELINYYSKNIN